ncbi:hypothetical protein Aduo_007926 [Ancylostoma duodenale]
MSPDAKALIAKLHHAVSTEPHLAYRDLSQFPNEPHHLDLMPANIDEWTKDHNVMRLSAILEALDRKPLHQIPAHRLLAHCYDTFYAANLSSTVKVENK